MPRDLAYPKVISNTVKRLPHRGGYATITYMSLFTAKAVVISL